MNFGDLPALIGASAELAWPLLAFVVLFIFRGEIRTLVGRLRSAKISGGRIDFGDLPGDLAESSLAIAAPVSASSGTIQSDKICDIYWLGHDLMWTIDALVRGAQGSEIVRGLERAVQHAAKVGLASFDLGEQLSRLHAEASGVDDDRWTIARRRDFASRLWPVLVGIGHVMEAHQPDYRR